MAGEAVQKVVGAYALPHFPALPVFLQPFSKTAESDFVVKVLQSSTYGIMMADKCDIGDPQEVIYMMTYAIVVFLRGLCTQNGIEVIDRCFDSYFGNIAQSSTL